MMNLPYHIQEGILTLPERYIDTSINVLRLPESSSSVVISRSILAPDVLFDDYLENELNNAAQQLPEYTLLDKREITWLDFDKVYLLVSHFKQGEMAIYQLVYHTVKQDKLTVFTYTQQHPFDDESRVKAESIFQSLVKYQ